MTRYKNGRPLPQGLLCTSDAAVIASKHQRTIVSWIRKGWLPAMRLPGGRGPYLIERRDLEELLVRLYTPQPYDPETKDSDGQNEFR